MCAHKKKLKYYIYTFDKCFNKAVTQQKAERVGVWMHCIDSCAAPIDFQVNSLPLAKVGMCLCVYRHR